VSGIGCKNQRATIIGSTQARTECDRTFASQLATSCRGLYGIGCRIIIVAVGGRKTETSPGRLRRALTEVVAAGGAEGKRKFDAMMDPKKFDATAMRPLEPSLDAAPGPSQWR
jgi:hypothetical protein